MLLAFVLCSIIGETIGLPDVLKRILIFVRWPIFWNAVRRYDFILLTSFNPIERWINVNFFIMHRRDYDLRLLRLCARSEWMIDKNDGWKRHFYIIRLSFFLTTSVDYWNKKEISFYEFILCNKLRSPCSCSQLLGEKKKKYKFLVKKHIPFQSIKA